MLKNVWRFNSVVRNTVTDLSAQTERPPSMKVEVTEEKQLSEEEIKEQRDAKVTVTVTEENEEKEEEEKEEEKEEETAKTKIRKL